MVIHKTTTNVTIGIRARKKEQNGDEKTTGRKGVGFGIVWKAEITAFAFL